MVLISPENQGSLDSSRNVYLIDRDNKILWQAEPATQSHGTIGFANVYLGHNNELLAYSKNGIEYRIDIATGSILHKELIK